eukprot:TRINITY_DN485_c0_g5_i1.p1 TRINITY_DN485_c0_g5~~TRINITY_DN485_c0_g5_i1.p1  ORF type:complete len:302 (-),score=52.99 TRINITY_DN485_c0_g5_i1:173-1021(-)
MAIFRASAGLVALVGGVPAAAQGVPACAWTREPCEPFTTGKYMVARLGEKSCPAGAASLVTDDAACRQAAKEFGLGYQDTDIQPGQACHYCLGCNPPIMRLNGKHGKLAKFICNAPEAPAAAAPAAAQSGEWPACQEQNTVIRGAGQALFTNLQGYGATIGCFLDDCLSSDKFVATEIESCTKVCMSLPECEYWVWGTEEGEQKCWFRTGDAGREAGEGWISGRKSCAPPGTKALTMGNDECWMEGFGYPECCDAKYGPNGNAQCWDGVYNYDRCCFPKEEL